MIIFSAIPITLLVGYLIIKKYNTQAILFAGGLLMLALGLISGHEVLPADKSSGAIFVDFFVLIKNVFSSTLASLGLIIMAAGGFSKYMNHIGAADAMVSITVKPLSFIKSPYLMLAGAYIIGQLVNIFIPSAVGLALLLLVAMYPALVKAGCNPAATAAVLATTACLDLGPASGNSNKAAQIIGTDAATYFIQYQIVVAAFVMVTVAVLHFFCQRYFDKKDAQKGISYEFNIEAQDGKKAPLWFAILPVLPLLLLLTFSNFAIKSIKIDVVSAMFISLFVSMIADFIHRRDFRKVADSLKVYLAGMGNVFATVVSLVIAAQIFVEGLRATGFIDMLLKTSANAGLGYFAMITVLVSIVGLTAFLSGSGNAAFFSFGDIAPDVAQTIGVSSGALVTPMQLSAGMFRSFSPVAGVVLACAGVADVSPIELVKRTAIPMIGGVVVMTIASYIFL